MATKEKKPKKEKPDKPKRSPVPLYIAGAVWVLYALFFPLYRLQDFLLVAILVGALFIIIYFVIPARKEKNDLQEDSVEAQEEELDPMTEVERAIAECDLYRVAIRKIKLKIFTINPELSLEVVRLEKGLARIAAHLEKYPEDAKRVRRFTQYYMPTALKHLNTYLEVQGTNGQNAAMISSNVEGILHTLAVAFEKLLDHLYADDALDIATDITVLEQLLQKEGLLEQTKPSAKE